MMVFDIHYRDTLELAGRIEVDDETGAATFLSGPPELERIVREGMSKGFCSYRADIERDGDRAQVDSYSELVTPAEAGALSAFEHGVMESEFLFTEFCTAGIVEVIRRNREEQARDAAPGRLAS